MVVFVAIPVGVPEARTTSISHEAVPVPLGFAQFKVAPFEVIAETANPVGTKHGESMATLSISHLSPSILVLGCV